MSTTITQLVAQVRTEINEPTANYWTDAELVIYAIDGIKDLWKAVKDTVQDHFFTIGSATMAANATSLTGVPTDIAEIRLIEPASPTTYPTLVFKPRKYNDPEFQNARSAPSVSPNSFAGVVYYAVTGAGAPVGAPTIYVAPPLSSDLAVSIMYVPTISATLATGDANPIPGESNVAVKSWMKAYALGRQNPDGTFEPDAAWLQVYSNEKDKLIATLAPRQTQEPEVVDGLFEALW